MKIHRLDFSKYDTTETFIEVTENKNEPYIRWGANNMYPYELLRLTDVSPIHNACLRSKIDAIVGMGFEQNYMMNESDSLNFLFRKMVFEYLVTGNLFLEAVWRRDRNEGLAGVHILPAKYMRVGKDDNYFYCREWWKPTKKNVIEFASFNSEDRENRQVIHIKQEHAAFDYYGCPDWISVINDVKLNEQISVFNLHNIKNGLSPSLWVHFNQQQPESENEQFQVLRKIEERYQGAENAGRVIISYGESEQKPEITQIQTNVEDGYFSSIFELVQRQIMSGHKIIDGSIIGLPSPQGFSSSADQLTTSYNLFLSTTIKPFQKYLIGELDNIVKLIHLDENVDLKIIQNKILE